MLAIKQSGSRKVAFIIESFSHFVFVAMVVLEAMPMQWGTWATCLGFARQEEKKNEEDDESSDAESGLARKCAS